MWIDYGVISQWLARVASHWVIYTCHDRNMNWDRWLAFAGGRTWAFRKPRLYSYFCIDTCYSLGKYLDWNWCSCFCSCSCTDNRNQYRISSTGTSACWCTLRCCSSYTHIATGRGSRSRKKAEGIDTSSGTLLDGSTSKGSSRWCSACRWIFPLSLSLYTHYALPSLLCKGCTLYSHVL